MIKQRIKKMSRYKPPLEGRTSNGYLLLDFNERTIEPSPKVKEALRKFIDFGKLQVYPEYGDLEKKIAQYAKVPFSQVMATNGGDQGIDIVCRAYLDQGDKVIIPFPGFAMHYQSAGIQGVEILEPRYKKNGDFPLKQVLELFGDKKVNLIRKGGVKLIILCNPNNPLGVSIPIRDVEKILKKAKEKNIAVLHDEAYFEFSGLTAKNLINKYDNLYIIRTFSKAFGLVAARAGYIISQKKNIQELLKIRGPYDVNMFAKTAILAALKNKKYMGEYVKEVMEKSKPKLENFLKQKEILFYKSAANFLFLRFSNPQKIIKALKSQGILVRLKLAPDGEEAVRVTVGTLKNTTQFIKRLTKVLDKVSF